MNILRDSCHPVILRAHSVALPYEFLRGWSTPFTCFRQYPESEISTREGDDSKLKARKTEKKPEREERL